MNNEDNTLIGSRVIDGEVFEQLVSSGASYLKTNKKAVNDLNVFPIPDGDTGDNMYMTLAGGLSMLKSCDKESLSDKASALAGGMILNARGNSGVILSQFFAGIAKGLEESASADTIAFAHALMKGVEQAYSAVMTPVEGTVLTVAREASEYMSSHVSDDDAPLADFFDMYVRQMKISLEKTPELLDVLAEAGVVDSGGAGLLTIFEGMLAALRGESLDTPIESFEATQKSVDFSKFNEESVMTFGYCTEFLLQLQKCKVENPASFDINIIIDYLKTIGDSIAAFMTGSIVKVHVHTLTPYRALEFCQQYGEFLTIKIENMTLQHNETDESFALNKKPKKKQREHSKFALVTVATGEGLCSAFTEFGADIVIEGGQTKNPSVDDFISAFDEVNSDNIFVLPNNSNIIMAANGAKELYESSHPETHIYVIETKSFGEAYSILSELDYSADDAEEIAAGMREAMSASVTGMITTSIRDVTLDGVDIKEGDYIGFSGKTMLLSEPSARDAFCKLTRKLGADERDFLIVFFGKDTTDEDMEFAREFVEREYPSIEYYSMRGEQEVYDYIIILE